MIMRQIRSCAGGIGILLLMAACGDDGHMKVAGGDAQRGKVIVQQYGCVACHVIPGLPNPGSNVGPPLVWMAKRGYIAGVLPNTPENMLQWLQDPPGVDPRTAMPNLGITDDQARHIAAYLYTLE